MRARRPLDAPLPQHDGLGSGSNYLCRFRDGVRQSRHAVRRCAQTQLRCGPSAKGATVKIDVIPPERGGRERGVAVAVWRTGDMLGRPVDAGKSRLTNPRPSAQLCVFERVLSRQVAGRQRRQGLTVACIYHWTPEKTGDRLL